MKVLTWNLGWAPPRSQRGKIIVAALEHADADVICLTEAFRASLPVWGSVIEASTGNAVADEKGAKKVLLWSRWGWEKVGTENGISPPGRYVNGVTQTPLGSIRIFGVCIPWRWSGTPRYRGNASQWEDHLQYLAGLQNQIRNSSESTLILGDFNQRRPRSREPEAIVKALDETLEDLLLATSGFRSGDGDLTIDHLACSRDLRISDLAEVPRFSASIELSDHFGIVGTVCRAADRLDCRSGI